MVLTIVDPAEILDVDSISVSAKFLRPLVCNRRFTGLIKVSNSIGLFTVYESD